MMESEYLGRSISVNGGNCPGEVILVCTVHRILEKHKHSPSLSVSELKYSDIYFSISLFSEE